MVAFNRVVVPGAAIVVSIIPSVLSYDTQFVLNTTTSMRRKPFHSQFFSSHFKIKQLMAKCNELGLKAKADKILENKNLSPGQKVQELKELIQKEEREECVICFEPLAPNDKVKVVTYFCKHKFHEDCSKPWLKQKNSCPCCRATVLCNAVNCKNYTQGEEFCNDCEKLKLKVVQIVQDIFSARDESSFRRVLKALRQNDETKNHKSEVFARNEWKKLVKQASLPVKTYLVGKGDKSFELFWEGLSSDKRKLLADQKAWKKLYAVIGYIAELGMHDVEAKFLQGSLNRNLAEANKMMQKMQLVHWAESEFGTKISLEVAGTALQGRSYEQAQEYLRPSIQQVN